MVRRAPRRVFPARGATALKRTRQRETATTRRARRRRRARALGALSGRRALGEGGRHVGESPRPAGAGGGPSAAARDPRAARRRGSSFAACSWSCASTSTRCQRSAITPMATHRLAIIAMAITAGVAYACQPPRPAIGGAAAAAKEEPGPGRGVRDLREGPGVHPGVAPDRPARDRCSPLGDYLCVDPRAQSRRSDRDESRTREWQTLASSSGAGPRCALDASSQPQLIGPADGSATSTPMHLRCRRAHAPAGGRGPGRAAKEEPRRRPRTGRHGPAASGRCKCVSVLGVPVEGDGRGGDEGGW